MAKKPRVLIVEDETAIRTGLVDVFVYHGYEVAHASDGNAGLEMALSGRYELVLLDVMLPGRDGFAICAAIRAVDPELAIIMLTAKSTDDDMIHGLALGADDYVTKPFSVKALVLRAQAVLRRARLGLDDGVIRLDGGGEIDTRNLVGRLVGPSGGTGVRFTRREMDILQYLAAHGDRPVPREELLHKVWGYARHLEIETRTVDIHVAKLRRKIEEDPKQPQHLVTVRGGGYRLMVAP